MDAEIMETVNQGGKVAQFIINTGYFIANHPWIIIVILITAAFATIYIKRSK